MEDKKETSMKKENQPKNQIILDASGIILGRLASYAAKQSLLGKNVIIVNCNDAALSGNRKMIMEEYARIRALDTLNLRGPIIPKVAEKFVKRTIRGMLQYKKGRGEDALKRIMCYNGVPEEYKNSQKIVLKEFSSDAKTTKTIKLSDVIKTI